jgi:hypothetical protein
MFKRKPKQATEVPPLYPAELVVARGGDGQRYYVTDPRTDILYSEDVSHILARYRLVGLITVSRNIQEAPISGS